MKSPKKRPQKATSKNLKTKNPYPLTWDLSPLAKNENDPSIPDRLARAKAGYLAFARKWQADKRWLSQPTILAKALKELNDLSNDGGLTDGFGYYLFLASSLDENSTSLKAQLGQLKDFAVPLENELDFFTNELSKIPLSTQKQFLKATELKDFHHYLSRLFENGRYILTSAEEKILNFKSAAAYGSWVRMTSNLLAGELLPALDDKGKKAKLNIAELMSLISSPKKPIRTAAAKALNELFAKYAPIAEHELNAILDDKKNNDTLRGYNRPDQARLVSDDIPAEVVDTMTNAVEKYFDLADRYYQLKAKLLRVKKLDYHERNVPIGETKSQFSYPVAVDLVKEVLTNLDPEFGQIFMGFVKNGQIDVKPKLGKDSGAFCAHDLHQFPTYILLNHTDRLESVLTLAHEVGHGINNELMKKKQPPHYLGTTLATAEVASTFMEDFVLEKLSQGVNDKERLSLLMTKLNSDISTIFRQVACYQFEKDLHQTFRQKGYLDKKEIGQLFSTHMKSYMGKAVNYYPGSENWWVYWSHIRNFFYVYSYASGLLISKALQRRVRADKSFIEKVKYFLSAGESQSPVEIFNHIGIDITKEDFWLSGLKEIEDLLTETTQLAKKLKLI